MCLMTWRVLSIRPYARQRAAADNRRVEAASVQGELHVLNPGTGELEVGTDGCLPCHQTHLKPTFLEVNGTI